MFFIPRNTVLLLYIYISCIKSGSPSPTKVTSFTILRAWLLVQSLLTLLHFRFPLFSFFRIDINTNATNDKPGWEDRDSPLFGNKPFRTSPTSFQSIKAYHGEIQHSSVGEGESFNTGQAVGNSL